MFLRFVVPTLHPDSGRRTGVFQAACALRDTLEIHPHERGRILQFLAWMNVHLERPERLAVSRRPHAKEQALSWFKPDARKHIARIYELCEILDTHGIRVEVLRTARPGYVIYEDEFQVVAYPFADTPT